MPVCAAPHCPAGHFSPYSDGEKGLSPAPRLFLLPVHGEKVPEGRMRGGASVCPDDTAPSSNERE
ncbi:hypothetical protein FJ987_05290 [Mesorhizobium sp. CU2]|nr:hypothetical protein FJ988_02960 [Mesorhizobium sp. CU3]TPO20313.1 hypothetical protein FJ987_05290 [Mesorhizobium sp. CU2]